MRSLTRGLAILTSCLLVAGCASVPPPTTCAAIGAALGGGGGALAGAKTDNHHDGDSIAGYGALGIVVGGGLGYLACAALQKDEPETPPPAPPAPVVERRAEPAPVPATPAPSDPCERRFDFAGVNFDFDKAVIRPEGRVILDGVSARLDECREVQVRIEGHTDAVGSDAYNQGLSERRARSVFDYLVTRGLEATRLQTRGSGESKPVASNATKEGRAMNRRVELHPTR